jgi:hypothetical protein
MNVLKYIVVREAILYSFVQSIQQGKEGTEIEAEIFKVVLRVFLLQQGCTDQVIQLLFGLFFEELKKGRVVQQYGFQDMFS